MMHGSRFPARDLTPLLFLWPCPRRTMHAAQGTASPSRVSNHVTANCSLCMVPTRPPNVRSLMHPVEHLFEFLGESRAPLAPHRSMSSCSRAASLGGLHGGRAAVCHGSVARVLKGWRKGEGWGLGTGVPSAGPELGRSPHSRRHDRGRARRPHRWPWPRGSSCCRAHGKAAVVAPRRRAFRRGRGACRRQSAKACGEPPPKAVVGLKALAGKHRSTVSKMAAKYRTTFETANGPRIAFEARIERKNRKPLVARFGGIPLQRQRTAEVIDREPARVDYPQKELVARLLADTCEICGSRGNVQVHHDRALADLVHAGWQPSDWTRVMLHRRRKTVVACDTCHDRIHSERPAKPLTQ
ncbi:hypothetical protein [Streptomyces sp. NPDC059003]|uniref:HNH endonuclease n=1 Tax=Streptomyces sp. NPDC059003 TaxID=3346691 RepID=UPI0036CCF622